MEMVPRRLALGNRVNPRLPRHVGSSAPLLAPARVFHGCDWLPGARALVPALTKGDADMPSQAMQDSIEALRRRQKASDGEAPPALEELRAAFVPGDRLHPVPDDVLVTDVNAGGVPAHWLAAPGVDMGRVLIFLHGG